MRITAVWTVAAKDFRIFVRKRNILYSIIGLEVFVSVLLPLIAGFIARKSGNPADVIPVAAGFLSFGAFVIGAALLPVALASYSLVGEKIQKCFEPLLVTPVEDAEILAGKALAALLPSLSVAYTGAVFYMGLFDLFTFRALGYAFYPDGLIAITLFVDTPIVCLFSVLINLLVSSRANDVRAAGQLGVLPVLPYAAVYVLAELSVLRLSPRALVVLAIVTAIADLLMLRVLTAAFRREEILTKWK